MRRLFSCAMAASALMASNYASADFEFEHGGHTYKVVTTPLTFADALDAADVATSSWGDTNGYLVNIESAAENEAIATQLASNVGASAYTETTAPDGGGAAYVWIGADDRGTEGSWVWNTLTGAQAFWSGDNTGSAVGGAYNNWGTDSGTQNEPDNFGPGQDAAGIALQTWPNPSLDAGFVLGTTGQWNDVAESNQLYYIIEWDTVDSTDEGTGGSGGSGGSGGATPVPTMPFYLLLFMSGLLGLLGLKRLKK